MIFNYSIETKLAIIITNLSTIKKKQNILYYLRKKKIPYFINNLKTSYGLCLTEVGLLV